jgi:trehalose-6-phosphate synthase
MDSVVGCALDPKKRIIVATHQLPWSYERNTQVNDNALQFSFCSKSGHSAQHAGSRSLHTDTQTVINVGWISSPKVEPSEFDALKKALWEEKSSVPVHLDADIAVGHYEGYCKSELWPLFHYVLWDNATDGVAEAENWAHYLAVNERFAEEICHLFREGDVIWIQDYHLLPLPGMLRKRLPMATIGFFLHTPFPSSELFRCLPNRVEILSGVLGSNMIGFQTYSHARHFISSCTRVLGVESSPNGVDFHGFNVAVEIFQVHCV